MSAATSCPRCFRQVSLPASDDHSVWVRCPLCSAQYPLQAALDFVPPMLQIVPAPALGAAEPVAASVGAQEHALAAGAFAAGTMFTPAGEHSEMPAADAGQNGHHAPAEHAADDFDAALSLEGDSKTDEDVPFMADSELADSEFAQDEAEHDPDEEFRFADEHPAAGDFGEAGEAAHGMAGDDQEIAAIATMASKPTRIKKKVPLKVKLLGITFFASTILVALVLLYGVSMYFGFSDPLNLYTQSWCPNWLAAKLRAQDAQRNVAKPPKSEGLRIKPNPTDAGTGSSTATTPVNADANGNQKNGQPGAVAPGDKPAGDNGTPATADSKNPGATKPDPNAVATQPDGKADPATNPFADPPKPNDPNAGKDDPTQFDPLGAGTKPPSLDLPEVKIGKKPDDKPAVDKPAVDKPATDTALDKPVDKPADKPLDKPAESVMPKSDATYAPGDLTTAVDAANRSNAALAEAVAAGDEAKLKMARIKNYMAMSHLATVLTFVKAGDAKAADQVEGLKSQVAASLAAPSPIDAPAERDSIGGLAGKWINAPTRKTSKEDGLFAAGTLKKTEPRGHLFESVVELPGGAAPITVVTTQKPAVEEGSPVLLLGAIVNEPAKNLAGYEGAAEMVIFGDVLVPPAKADGATPPAVDPDKKPAGDASKPTDPTK